MAKEKRAFVDEAIQDTAPTEGLEVSERPVVDLSSTIAAEGLKPGSYFSPIALKDLADISKDIHDTRRNSRQADYNIRKSEYVNNYDVQLANYDRELKQDRDTTLLNHFTAFYANYADAIEKAKRAGIPQKMVNAEFAYKAQNDLDRYAKESPYMYEQFLNYSNNLLRGDLSRIIPEDNKLREDKHMLSLKTSAATMNTKLLLEGGMVGDYLDQFMLNTLIPTCGEITNEKEQEFANTVYNQTILTDFKRIESMVKIGAMTPEEGRTYIYGSLSKWARHDYTGKRPQLSVESSGGYLGGAGEGEEKEVEQTLNCALTPETVESARQIANNLMSTKSKMQSVYAAEEYFEYVGKDAADKGKFDEIPFYTYGTVQEANDLLARTYAALAPEIAQGNEQAVKDWAKILRYHYFTVVPRVAVREAWTAAVQATGNVAEARKRFEAALSELNQVLLHPGENISTDLQSLIFQTPGGYLNLNYPTDDLVRHGVDSETNRRNFYKSTRDAFQDMLNYPDLAVRLNPDFQKAQNDFLNKLNADTLVSTDVQTGTVVPNQEGIASLAQTWKSARNAQVAAAGNMIVGVNSEAGIKALTTSYGQVDGKRGEMLLRSAAEAANKAGTHDLFYAYNYNNLSTAEKNVANKMAMYSLLLRDSQNSNTKNLLNSVTNNIIGGKYPNPTDRDADSILKGRFTHNGGKANIMDLIEKKITEYNIDTNDRPMVRYALKNIAVAEVEKDEKAKFDALIFDRVLSNSYSKGGTFLGQSVLSPEKGGAMSTVLADSIMAKSNKASDRYLKNLTGKGGLTTRVNPQNANLQLYQNGSPFLGTGKYDPLKGSGVVPFEISTKMKSGWDESKFADTVSVTSQLAVGAGTIQGIKTNTRVQTVANRVAPKVPYSTIQKEASTLLESIRIQSNQEKVQEWRMNNYKDMVITEKAPKELVDILFYASVMDNISDTVGTNPYVQANVQVYQGAYNWLTKADTPLSTALKSTVKGTQVVGQKIQQAIGGKSVRDVVGKVKEVGAAAGDIIPKAAVGSTPLTDAINADKQRYWDFEKQVDAYWSLRNNKNKVSMVIPPSATAEAKGITGFASPTFNAEQIINSSGLFTVTSKSEGKHAKNSEHYKGRAMDIGILGGFGKCIDPNTGIPSNRSMDVLVKTLKPLIDSGEIVDIGTSYYPKLPAKYKNMKNSKGKPLFTYYPTDHFDHFHANFSTKVVDPKSNKALGISIKDYAYNSSKYVTENLNKGPYAKGFIRPELVRGLTYSNPNYVATDWDAKNCGVAKATINNDPYKRQIAQAAKFLDGMKALNNSVNLTVMGINGATFDFLPEDKGLAPMRNISLEKAIDFSRNKTGRGRFVLHGSSAKYDAVVNKFIKGQQ